MNTILARQLTATGVLASLILLIAAEPKYAAQDEATRLRVNVVLVQLSVAVTDRDGNYVSGLKPENFQIIEDKIPQRISTFEEGSGAAMQLTTASAAPRPAPPAAADATAGQSDTANSDSAATGGENGANVFILFDTSNYMYRGFVFAQDAISDFVRSMDTHNKIAFYSYNRDLSRVTSLTPDRFRVVSGVRSTVAGDNAALYNGLLLTVRDAAPLTGRKAIVVFSNGPDDASSVPPEDVAELAQSTGTIIYIVSTRLAEEEPVSAAAFERMSKATGGKAYFASNWRKEKQAFDSIREDLGHLYSISYYPQPNPNRGWRNISVKLVGKDTEKYHIRTRDGYRMLQSTAFTSPLALANSSQDGQK